MGEKEGFLPFPESFETVCIHHSQDPNLWKSKAIIPHIVPSTIFKLDDPRLPMKYIYSRFGNPNRSLLEKTMAAVNKSKFAVCFASGVSALTGVLGLLKSGDNIVCCDDVSPDTHQLFKNVAPHYSLSTTFVDVDETENLCKAINDCTKLIWVENPSYTALKITDICQMATIAKEKGIILGVDNTFLTPYLQRPLELDADLVMQSATKYINGHSDILMGCVCTNKPEINKELSAMQIVGGLNPSPFDCYQVLRSMKTLSLRMDHHIKNSVVLANYLGQHSAVEKVIHPGLKNHPQHKLFKTQASAHSGIISFYLKGKSSESEKFLKSLKVFTVTEISGGSESTAQIPYSMSHRCFKQDEKKKLNITENLIRLSVGLENICDLISDIETALDSIKPKSVC